MKLSEIKERKAPAAQSLLECMREIKKPSSEELCEMIISFVLFSEENQDQVSDGEEWGTCLCRAYNCALASERDEDYEMDLISCVEAEMIMRDWCVKAYKQELGQDANSDEVFSWPENSLKHNNNMLYERGFVQKLGFAIGYREALRFKAFRDWHKKAHPEENK